MGRIGIATLLFLVAGAGCGLAQDRITRRAAENVLDWMHRDVKRFYFDSTFNGVNLDSLHRATRARLKRFDSDTELNYILASYFKPLADSHSYYVPPGYVYSVDYGFDVKFFAEDALITKVRAGTDAERAGLHAGDRVHLIDGRPVNRKTFLDWVYEYYVVAPRQSLQLVVTTADGKSRQVTITATVKKTERLGLTRIFSRPTATPIDEDSVRRARSHIYFTVDSVMVWKLSAFWYDDPNISKLFDLARDHKVLILDLRGNGGGAVETLRQIVGQVIPEEIVIASLRGRKKTEVLKSKPGRKVFNGRLIVLVDSESGSASEVFARLMQLRERATIIGDRTAGAVRVSELNNYRSTRLAVGASITVADLIMPDGQPLEGMGVQPDQMAVLRNYNLADGSDPALAFALNVAGIDVAALAAAQMLENGKTMKYEPPRYN